MTNDRIRLDRALRRLVDIKDRISAIRALLEGKGVKEIESDVVVRAAFERFLEVISEASRHIPEDWTAAYPDIPWRKIKDLGNRLRHVYQDLDLQILWDIYARDLGDLESAVSSLLVEHAPAGWSP